MHEEPLLWQRLGSKGGLGQPSHVETRGCVHHGLDSCPHAVFSLHSLNGPRRRDFSVGDCCTQWYQQKPGSPPQYVLKYYSDSHKHQGSKVPSHFSESKDTAAIAGVLHISGLQIEDEADYYCGTYHATLALTQGSRCCGVRLNLPCVLPACALMVALPGIVCSSG